MIRIVRVHFYKHGLNNGFNYIYPVAKRWLRVHKDSSIHFTYKGTTYIALIPAKGWKFKYLINNATPIQLS
jgi:hypothetical protein